MTAIPTPTPLLLEPGDHLTRDEFERRSDAMPGLKKAELIDGVVHMPSPVRWNSHASPTLTSAPGWGHTRPPRPAPRPATRAASGWTRKTSRNRTPPW